MCCQILSQPDDWCVLTVSTKAEEDIPPRLRPHTLDNCCEGRLL